jgi:hypothetical protein
VKSSNNGKDINVKNRIDTLRKYLKKGYTNRVILDQVQKLWGKFKKKGSLD